jgi:hypothetical protein
MLVKFKGGLLEARFKMDAVPRRGDLVLISDNLYEVTNIRWELVASQTHQVAVVTLSPHTLASKVKEDV